MTAQLGIRTTEAIVSIQDVFTTLRENLKANVDVYTSSWHRGLCIGDTVLCADLFAPATDDPLISSDEVTEPYFGGLVTLRQAGDVPAAAIIAPVAEPLDIPLPASEIVIRARSDPSMIVTTTAPPIYAYKGENND